VALAGANIGFLRRPLKNMERALLLLIAVGMAGPWVMIRFAALILGIGIFLILLKPRAIEI
jgi:hypothetical protein